MSIKLKSGFTFDYDNLFGEGKVTKADIEAFGEKLKEAHKAMNVMRETGVIKGHLSKDGEPEKVLFSQCPYIQEGPLNSPESMKRLQDLRESVRNRVDAVVSLGIGGSYLGNKVLFDIQCGEFWNSKSTEERNGYPKFYFSGNNIDPRRTKDLIDNLEDCAEITKTHYKRNYKVMLIVISKSGGTLDTMSNFMVVYDALKKNPQIEVEVVAVTDPNLEKPTLLKQMAIDHNWPQFSVPDGVGGRFTVFTDVGLTTAACIGFDIDEFLRGARDMDEACKSDNVWENPAKFDKEGNEVCYGRTPVVALGTRDMHSQTQQHQEGMLDNVVQFIRVEKWENDLVIPNVFPEVKKLADISGVTMGDALEVARQSNADALASNKRFNALFSLPEMNAYHLGELLYMLAMSVAYEGEFANVDAFDQPGVEAYKRIMGPKLQELKAKQ